MPIQNEDSQLAADTVKCSKRVNCAVLDAQANGFGGLWPQNVLLLLQLSIQGTGVVACG
jgi:hypothetical protein